MALLNILKYPDIRLKKIASPLAMEDVLHGNSIKIITDNMLETMYQAQGIGLAATQVNIHLQIITIDIPAITNGPLCILNPTIIKQHEIVNSTEGCLSFPGVSAKIPRAKVIEIEFLDLHGKQQLLKADNLLSFCIQHEIDHLNGKTFFDYLSPLKRSLLEKKLNKLKKLNN